MTTQPRTLAIGDIHGCISALRTLWETIKPQPWEFLTIIHKKFGTPLPHQSGKTMICGHTAQKSYIPANLGHAICIDTDPGRGGWLSCLNVGTDRYWQANITGEVRENKLLVENS